jgi:hypothetical protein
MKKILLSVMFTFLMVLNLLAQNPDRKQMSSADRASTTVSELSHMVTLTDKQRSDITTIYTKFFDDVHAQQAFRDPSKLEPLEKDRDAKVEKLLKSPKLYKQYQDAVKSLKERNQQRQHQK